MAYKCIPTKESRSALEVSRNAFGLLIKLAIFLATGTRALLDVPIMKYFGRLLSLPQSLPRSYCLMPRGSQTVSIEFGFPKIEDFSQSLVITI
uniref:AlNc14C242G9485 protein n=1 Tax=Albugo laibachii Nc14 TaxID=890382 RepID=F0WSZ5_9STRA|nr:AlNc14C242G9485 [Albugo laibachii Nc14]|eukprot:CCA24480.1 AlNc14C242G9485 [Albugo laibachii Nc14]